MSNDSISCKSEANLLKTKKYDAEHVVLLQNVLRGYIDRKKAVEYTHIRYAIKSKAGSRRQPRHNA
jgi:hypothetical protein